MHRSGAIGNLSLAAVAVAITVAVAAAALAGFAAVANSLHDGSLRKPKLASWRRL